MTTIQDNHDHGDHDDRNIDNMDIQYSVIIASPVIWHTEISFGFDNNRHE